MVDRTLDIFYWFQTETLCNPRLPGRLSLREAQRRDAVEQGYEMLFPQVTHLVNLF